MKPIIHAHQHHAMATVFEIRLVTADQRYARQAAEACFRLLDVLEGRLSRFLEDSDIACLNRLAPGERRQLHPDTAACLREAITVSQWTGGAFDPTISPTGPSEGRLVLDPSEPIAEGSGVSLDLGGIGKGFALDRMAELLDDWELFDALLIAGKGSSVLARGRPAEALQWRIALGGDRRFAVELRDFAISSSGTTVKGAHILDPRNGCPPVDAPGRTWALSRSAAVSDALSTAWMCLEAEEVEEVCASHPEIGAILKPTSPPNAPLCWYGKAPSFRVKANS